MKGVHAELRGKFSRSVENYIIVSRILQGQDDLRCASTQEQNDIVMRFNRKKDDMKGLQQLKAKGKQTAPSGGATTTAGDDADSAGPIPDSPPKTGFWATRHLNLEERKKLHAAKEAWKKKQNAAAAPPPRTPGGTDPAPRDEDFERAIRESVSQTSRGDPSEDAVVESQMRASVREMRRVAEENRMRDFKERPAEPPAKAGGDVTDEEFEALVAEAVRQSLGAQGQGEVGGEQEDGVIGRAEIQMIDEDLRQALGESRLTAAAGGSGGGEGDEELRRALEESEQAHREHVARTTTERSEEEIILEYVKKQSLAEQEYRRKQAAAASGKGATTGEGGDEDEDEDLRRALEESLRMSGKGGGPLGS